MNLPLKKNVGGIYKLKDVIIYKSKTGDMRMKEDNFKNVLAYGFLSLVTFLNEI